MKKNIIVSVLLGLFLYTTSANAQTEFTRALGNCDKYSINGTIPKDFEIYNVTITLDKAKGDKCIYKEKINHGNSTQILTCTFNKGQLPFLKKSMEDFSNTYKSEIAKNRIFEAKMTTNSEIFQNVLVNPEYCTIGEPKKK